MKIVFSILLIVFVMNVFKSNTCFAGGCQLGGIYEGKKENREKRIGLTNPKKATFDFLSRDDISKEDQEKIKQKGLALFTDFKEELANAKVKDNLIWSVDYFGEGILPIEICKKIIQAVNSSTYRDFDIFDCRMGMVAKGVYTVSFKNKEEREIYINLSKGGFYILYWEKENEDDWFGIAYVFDFVSEGYEKLYDEVVPYCKRKAPWDKTEEAN